jgi:hypothetical protein
MWWIDVLLADENSERCDSGIKGESTLAILALSASAAIPLTGSSVKACPPLVKASALGGYGHIR